MEHRAVLVPHQICPSHSAAHERYPRFFEYGDAESYRKGLERLRKETEKEQGAGHFVVAKARDIWAVEVKSGRSGKAHGLTRFRTRFPEAKALLVGGQGILLKEFFSKDAGLWLVS